MRLLRHSFGLASRVLAVHEDLHRRVAVLGKSLDEDFVERILVEAIERYLHDFGQGDANNFQIRLNLIELINVSFNEDQVKPFLGEELRVRLACLGARAVNHRAESDGSVVTRSPAALQVLLVVTERLQVIPEPKETPPKTAGQEISASCEAKVNESIEQSAWVDDIEFNRSKRN